MTQPPAIVSTSSSIGRADDVAQFFNESGRYVEKNHNIWIRRDIVAAMLGTRSFRHCIDIGCGDAQISTAITHQVERFTLVDFSPSMLEAAAAAFGKCGKSNVHYVQGNIELEPLAVESGDLVLALGLLAHLHEPAEVIRRISTLLAPGGLAIIQNFDASHPCAKALLLYAELRTRLGMNPYLWNEIREQQLLSWTEKAGLRLVGKFRYSLPLPGFRRLFTAEQLYRLTDSIFGNYHLPKRQALGFEVVYCFERP